jgi:hypothetical protein
MYYNHIRAVVGFLSFPIVRIFSFCVRLILMSLRNAKNYTPSPVQWFWIVYYRNIITPHNGWKFFFTLTKQKKGMALRRSDLTRPTQKPNDGSMMVE